ncbi:HTH domain-containing protein [Pedobacter chinensis]|uniref:HTH domain-containing protein n=1 Tax=Pedobacter chinensis TaxID=2282421 RepID=A0A369PYI9_9SPHI|nr:HTH domain-containing protein [Pedobacter chinensis]RDC57310.1 HTH domain-containing protein [Pedobacter chinensis]
MKIFEYIDRINLLHKLIKERKTGTPEKLAKRLNISKGRLYQLIEELRLMEVPIAYSRSFETYYYTLDYEISASLSLKNLSASDMLKINAGLKLEHEFQLFYSL